MALTLNVDTDKSISLKDFVEYIKRNVDFTDDASICESAWMLKALSNNKGFFTEALNDELLNWELFQKNNKYTSQTFAFVGEDDFMVRANVWVPPSEIPEEQTWTNEMFYYLVPHDHNFSFLTVGFYGSGYETTIYEYDEDTVLGEIGEKVNLRFLENTSLPEGKMMYYRANKDIHSQAHPKEFSISLNLLVSPPEQGYKDQYCFDFNSQTISSDVATTNMCRIMLCKLASYIGDGRSVNLLESLSKNHPTPRVRAEAYASLASLEPGDREKIWQTAILDKSLFVRKRATNNLGAL
ncbi:MAG: HEAT repeat domain-containing protein [Pyrinomonadaceae bacterium]